MPSNMDRYRNLKENGKLTPKAGAAVVTFSSSTDFSSARPTLNHKPGQMQLASAYRQRQLPVYTPETERESPSSLRYLQGEEAVAGNEATEKSEEQRIEEVINLHSRASPKLTPTSLFDPAKQHRYEKFKGRVRLSSSSTDSTRTEQRDDKQSMRTDSHDLAPGIYRHITPEPVIYPPSTQRNNPPTEVTKMVSPSQRSAFKTPRSFVRRAPSPTQNSLDLPGPPSLSISSSLSLNQNHIGLPIASARHETPKNAHHQPPSVSSQGTPRMTPPLSAYATPSHQRSSPKLSSKEDPSRANWEHEQERKRNLPPPGVHLGASRPKPSLAVNPKSTPTSKPPPMNSERLASSFDRGMTAQPPHLTNGSSSNSTETSSQTTTSTVRRDRLLEARESIPQEQELSSRPPLVEHLRPPIHDAHNRPSPARSTEQPSLRSSYSFNKGDMSTPVRESANQQPSPNSNHGENKGVSPLDFYRRIAAEKTRQASFAKQHSQPSPTHKAQSGSHRSLTPTPKSSTPQSPMFLRGDSPMSLPNYRSEAPRRVASFPMLDQRTVRILYSMDFDQLIEEHIQTQTKDLLLRYSRGTPNRNPEALALYARKRPLLEDEAANKEFDVINAETGQSNAMVVYITSMLADLQTKDIHANLQEFDHVFSEFSPEEDVYALLARPEVMRAQAGGLAGIVVFGHSDAGKSHNMLEIEERAAYDLFESSHDTAPPSVSVQFLELMGTHFVDLLGSHPDAVHISDEAGCFRMEGATTKTAGNPRELLRILSDGRHRLMRSSGNRTDHGYILCQLTVNQKRATGHLSLLECPGSELVVDGGGPSSTFRGLMDRIRTKAEGKIHDHPFRGLNFVTKAMQHIFDSPNSKISLLATVSPAASCTEETLMVLDVLASVAPVHVQKRKPYIRPNPSPMPRVHQQANASPTSSTSTRDELSLPRQWSRDELMDWMARKHLQGDHRPYDIDGRKAMRMTKPQLQDTFYGTADRSKADRLHQALRAENDRVARMRVKARMAQERERMSGKPVS